MLEDLWITYYSIPYFPSFPSFPYSIFSFILYQDSFPEAIKIPVIPVIPV